MSEWPLSNRPPGIIERLKECVDAKYWGGEESDELKDFLDAVADVLPVLCEMVDRIKEPPTRDDDPIRWVEIDAARAALSKLRSVVV